MQSGIYSYPATSRIVYGIDFAEALKRELDAVPARRVYVISSGTLARSSDVILRVQGALGERFAGVCASIGAHTPRNDVVTAADAACTAHADLLLGVGGGSVADAAKMIALCLGYGITEPAHFDTHHLPLRAEDNTRRPGYRPLPVSSLIIPTTLSAAEYSALAGCTDTVRGVKQIYLHPQAAPRTVILDPAVTVHTPQWLWLSSGIRAVDHAVEYLCSIASMPFSDAASLHALRLLGPGLRAVKADPSDLEARLDCQLGAWMSTIGNSAGAPIGASHGIGHVLGGTAGVPHGYTSCVMLPHVMRFNSPVNAERQKLVSEALGRPGEPADEVVGALIADLGLPRTLREVGVSEELFDRIAAQSMHERGVHANPRKIESADIVRKLLEAAW